jgi:signal transduction histidine kinase
VARTLIRVDAASLSPVDLLAEIRAALDDVEPLLAGRVVDIEMSRLRVLVDPPAFRRDLADLVGSAVEQSDLSDTVTVHVARTGRSARLEVRNEAAPGAAAAGAGDTVVGSMTLPLDPSTSGPAHA